MKVSITEVATTMRTRLELDGNEVRFEDMKRVRRGLRLFPGCGSTLLFCLHGKRDGFLVAVEDGLDVLDPGKQDDDDRAATACDEQEFQQSDQSVHQGSHVS